MPPRNSLCRMTWTKRLRLRLRLRLRPRGLARHSWPKRTQGMPLRNRLYRMTWTRPRGRLRYPRSAAPLVGSLVVARLWRHRRRMRSPSGWLGPPPPLRRWGLVSAPPLPRRRRLVSVAPLPPPPLVLDPLLLLRLAALEPQLPLQPLPPGVLGLERQILSPQPPPEGLGSDQLPRPPLPPSPPEVSSLPQPPLQLLLREVSGLDQLQWRLLPPPPGVSNSDPRQRWLRLRLWLLPLRLLFH